MRVAGSCRRSRPVPHHKRVVRMRRMSLQAARLPCHCLARATHPKPEIPYALGYMACIAWLWPVGHAPCLPACCFGLSSAASGSDRPSQKKSIKRGKRRDDRIVLSSRLSRAEQARYTFPGVNEYCVGRSIELRAHRSTPAPSPAKPSLLQFVYAKQTTFKDVRLRGPFQHAWFQSESSTCGCICHFFDALFDARLSRFLRKSYAHCLGGGAYVCVADSGADPTTRRDRHL